jgi:hypothetical protein
MSENMMQAGDEKLGKLLRAARPVAELPLGFQNNVWRRIEKGEQPKVGLAELLAGLFLKPKLATAGLATVVLLAAGAGAMHGMKSGEREARDRYVASVDPSHSHR